MKKLAIIVSGYFNPLHKGHLEYFHFAKEQGDVLFVIVNSDYQRQLKKSQSFQNEDERVLIISSLKIVDQTILSIDKDRTVQKTIQHIYDINHENYHLAFANGGDQNNQTIPEKSICKKLGIKLIDGLGKKIQSSSWLLKNKSINNK